MLIWTTQALVSAISICPNITCIVFSFIIAQLWSHFEAASFVAMDEQDKWVFFFGRNNQTVAPQSPNKPPLKESPSIGFTPAAPNNNNNNNEVDFLFLDPRSPGLVRTPGYEPDNHSVASSTTAAAGPRGGHLNPNGNALHHNNNPNPHSHSDLHIYSNSSTGALVPRQPLGSQSSNGRVPLNASKAPHLNSANTNPRMQDPAMTLQPPNRYVESLHFQLFYSIPSLHKHQLKHI